MEHFYIKIKFKGVEPWSLGTLQGRFRRTRTKFLGPPGGSSNRKSNRENRE